tara:strand:+ start:1156 stop:1971 length:816 start_codon:yes stop_codon:yes gene_type:complete
MAVPTSKATFKEYCLRNLGKPVIDINVDEDQVDDRIDEALQYFAQYHYDGVERVYLKHAITQAEIDRAKTNASTSATDKVDNSITASWSEGKGFIPVPDSVMSIIKVFDFTDKNTTNMFDIRYQLRLNDLYDFSSESILHYEMTMQHLDFLDHILVGEKPIRFNQHQNRLYLDMDWTNDMEAGEFIIIECYRKLNPDTYTDIYDDIYLKRYATALIKRQWGANLSKFEGVQMLGGVTLNGAKIFEEAQADIEKLEEQIQLAYELPPNYMIG